jgi:hypothetical protein
VTTTVIVVAVVVVQAFRGRHPSVNARATDAMHALYAAHILVISRGKRITEPTIGLLGLI